MESKRQYKPRTYTVARQLLALRIQARFTQAELAQVLGVSKRSILKWEGGDGYPSETHLRDLIEVFVARGAFTPDHERHEAEALWSQVSQDAGKRLGLFNVHWFERLLADRPDILHINRVPGTDEGRDRAYPADGSSPSFSGSPAARVAIYPPARAGAPAGPPFLLPPFVGRHAELAEIARSLGDPACRLLSLLGPGGIGKTRLALQVASMQSTAFRDGIVFVALASVGAPNQIVSAIGDVLNLSFAGQTDPIEYLLGYLRDKHMLLILDNFEHLLEGADLAYTILQRAPHVTILATSRERLNLQAEWLFDVEGLSYPQEDLPEWIAPPNLAEMAGYSAVQLFAQWAAQVQLGFLLTESTIAAVVRICQHVAGMPLAIELAAASVRTLPIAEIERRIRANLDFLSTTLRDVPARHRSMRAVFDHSWRLLSEPEQALFSRLAVFRGGCTAVAAEQVSGATLQALAALVEKSLLRRESSEGTQPFGSRGVSGAADEPRFAMLEPIREYALGQLAARAEAKALQRAHATYYLALAEAAAAEWDSPAVDAWIAQLDREHDNMRAALQWARDAGERTIGLQLAKVLWKFWRRRGYLSEGRQWLAELLALDADAVDALPEGPQATAVKASTWLASDEHDFAQVMALFQTSIAQRRTLGQTIGLADLLMNGAREARDEGNYARAATLLEESLAQHRDLVDRAKMHRGDLGLVLQELAMVTREQGDFARATTLWEECLDLYQASGNRESIGVALLGLGDIARDQGDVARVRVFCEESLAIFRDVDQRWGIGYSLNNLALAAQLKGDLALAANLAEESVGLFRSLQAGLSLAEVLVTLGRVRAAQGEVGKAQEILLEALRLAWAEGPRWLLAATMEALAALAVQLDQPEQAARLLGATAALRDHMGAPARPVDRPTIAHALATAQAALGDAGFARVWAEAGAHPLDQVLSLVPGALPPAASPASLEVPPATLTTPHARPLLDWGEAIDVPILYGREAELATLEQWMLSDRCRVVALLGLGGIGKTSVALSFARQAAANFQVVLFRSLRNAPPLGPLLDQLIWASDARQAPPDGIYEKITLLVQLYRERRCLLVLDNFETLLQAGAAPGQYLAGYADYGTLIQRLAESTHQSCLILTSREKPAELGPLEGRTAPVRSLLLAGLPDEACQPILAAKELIGSGTEYAALAQRYGGNPLALKLVSEPIQEIFGGDISAFLANDELFFNGVGALLDQQFMRSTPLEQAVLYWLAITRDLTPLDALIEHQTGVISQREVLQALEALRRRLLIERGAGAPSFTLQPVIMEYVTARLVMAACDELINGQLALLCSHALVQATAKDYVRHSQEQLIAAPVLERVVALSGGAQAGERRLADFLAQLRAWSFAEQRYGPGNVVNLLRLLRGSLRGLDLSRLAIRQAYLQEIEAQDVRLNGAYLTQSVLAEAFEYGTCVALSRDGAYLAASTQSGEVRLWRVADRTLVMSLAAHTGGTYGMAIAADGQLLVSSAIDGTAKIWAAPSGRLLTTLQGHIGGVNCVALTHDQRLVVSGGADGTLRLWDTSSAACRAIFHGHRDAVWDVAFVQNDQLLVSSSSDGTIKLWQTSSGQNVATLSGHAGPVWGVALAADGRLLASGGADGTVRLWDIDRRACLAVLQGHTGGVRGVALAADGRLLASGGMDRAIRLWDVSAALGTDVSGEACLAVLEGHTTGVWDLALTADGQLLASASFDGTIRLWEPYSRTSRAVLQGHSGAIRTVMLAAHGQLLASGSFGGIIRLWETDAELCRLTLHAHDGMVFGVALSADQQMLASGGHDGMLRLWDASSGRPFATLRGHTDAICAVAWSADGAILASGSRDGTIRLWDAVSGACRATWQADRAGIRDIALLADGWLIASASFGGSVGLWDVGSGRSLWMTQAHTGLAWRVALAGGGQLLASAGEDGIVRVWNVENGHCQATLVGHSGAVYGVALTADGRRAISGGHDGTIRWWDTEDGTCLAIIERHSAVWNVALTADGRRAVSGEHDGTLRVWDTDTGVLLHTLRADRPYERMDITGLTGVTEAQRAALRALGAMEQGDEPKAS